MARNLVGLINRFDIATRVMVSSFSTAMLSAIQNEVVGEPEFITQSLRNFEGGPDDYTIPNTMHGVNMIYT